MGLLFRAIFREVASSAILGTILFTFVLFLQRVGRLFEILVRSSAPPATVAHLFALAIPFTLTFTLPLGVLVGVLIALSRMSSDGEITAMRAAGVPSRKVIAPVLTFALLATLVTAAASLWLTPYSTWRTYKILNQLVAAELTAEVQPRVFEENFPNRMVYVSEVIPGTLTHWRNVFIADLTPPDEQKKDDHDHGDGPRVTVASEAIAVPDVARNVIQMSLNNGVSYDVGKDITQYFITSAPKGEQILEATKPGEIRAKAYTEIDTLPLYRIAYQDPALEPDKRIEAQNRTASAFGAASGLLSAGPDRYSAGCLHSQGRKIDRLRVHGGFGVHLLDGDDWAPTAWPSSINCRWAWRCGSPTRCLRC